MSLYSTSAFCNNKKITNTSKQVVETYIQPTLFFSTSRLHDIADMELVSGKIEKLTQNFSARCQDSDFVVLRKNHKG